MILMFYARKDPRRNENPDRKINLFKEERNSLKTIVRASDTSNLLMDSNYQKGIKRAILFKRLAAVIFVNA